MIQRRLVAFFAIALFVVAQVTLPGLARAGMHHDHMGPIGFYLMNQDRLGLSSDQTKKLMVLKMEFMKTKVMEKARIHVLHMETMALMMHHNIDVGQVQKNMDKVLAHKKKIMRAFVTMVAGAHKVLTNEQFVQVKKLWREMMLMHHGMMGHHPPLHHPGM
ncbi:MAG: periplasmic heavy metal sensor [Leptospirillia bacterium]